MKKNLSLPALLAFATGLALCLTFAVSAPAEAARLGNLIIAPATGTAGESPYYDTAPGQKCPVGTTGYVFRMTGPGVNTTDVLAGFTSAALAESDDHVHMAATKTFSSFFTDNNLADPSGDFLITAECIGEDFFTVTDTFDVTLTFTPAAGDYTGTYVTKASGQSTSTALGLAPTSPIASGASTTLTATVTPSSAVGAVQFKRGTTNIGAPVAVGAGTAAYTGALPAGSHSLTAVFQPTDPNAFLTSTSEAASYVVVGTPAITGTVRVASTVSCSVTAGGTIAYAWLKNGVATTTTTKSVKIPASWYNQTIACKATVTHDAASLSRTSAGKKVAVGAALKNVTKPTAAGTARAGSRLTCRPGTWSPTASSYKYAWLRDGRAISGKTASTYLVASADRRHKISCRVTAVKTGYANGVATSAARLIG